MPNWVTTNIEIKEEGDKLEIIKKSILNDEGEVDFNILIPMPLDLRGTSSPARVIPDEEYKEALEKGGYINYVSKSKSDALIEKYGFNNWYDWATHNYGTKWNASDTRIEKEENIISFDTAWSCPYPWLDILSQKFPNTIFKFSYADEDIGHNLGFYTLEDGQFIEEMDMNEDDKQNIYIGQALAVKYGNVITPIPEDVAVSDALDFITECELDE